jgi:inosine-uridine nucleoside N-ribohydrolase
VRVSPWTAVVILSGLVACTPAPHERASDVDREPVPVWIDTDPAAGLKDRDVDDGLALVQAFHSPELAIRGVSVVFGNASLEEGLPIATTLVERFGPPGLQVWRGAVGPTDLGVETPASLALTGALGRGPLTILMLGPATNVATVLRRNPDVAGKVRAVVAVAGRRPGQRFTTGSTNPSAHRDFNFEQDPAAFAVLLESGVPLVLLPFEISSKIWITAADLDRLDRGGEPGRWLAQPARAWLELWREVFAVDGFNPFDTLAVGYVTNPDWMHCHELPVRIRVGPDDTTEQRMQGTVVIEKPYLEVADLAGTRRAIYCSEADGRFKADLLRRLTLAP